MTYDQILNDIKDAMFEKNSVKRDCLRGIVSEIKNQTVNAGKPLTEEICLNVIKKSVKQHIDSIESFKLGKREDLALKEMEELSYIKKFMPQVLDEEQTKNAILEILKEVEPIKKNFGIVMKKLSGNIDKKIASSILNTLLK